MAHLNYDNPEIILQILGLLRLFTDDANIESQKVIFEEISGDRNSVFCRRVYELLEEVISTFSETWAKLVQCTYSMTNVPVFFQTKFS